MYKIKNNPRENSSFSIEKINFLHILRLRWPMFPFPKFHRNESAYGTTHRTRNDTEHTQESGYDIIYAIVLHPKRLQYHP